MRQLTPEGYEEKDCVFSKLPMRQLTLTAALSYVGSVSKLPMRQLTGMEQERDLQMFSKLPMRQLTLKDCMTQCGFFSKLPMRQLTMPERKKNPTARALIHLFSTLTQIYSCFEIY